MGRIVSADNWEICPYCLKEAEASKKIAAEKVELLYGQIPMAEFLELQRESRVLVEEEAFRTFREDYEFYVKDGKVIASYSGWCTTCKRGLNFKHEEPLPGLETEWPTDYDLRSSRVDWSTVTGRGRA